MNKKIPSAIGRWDFLFDFMKKVCHNFGSGAYNSVKTKIFQKGLIEMKKILDSEILTDEQLDYVVGGTRQETRDLEIALNARLYGIDFSPLNINNAEDMLHAKDDLESELAKFGMTVKIDVGKNGTGVGEQANEYYNSKGVKISQENMLKIFAPK